MIDGLILHCYRVLWSDFLILYDATTIYYKRRPNGKSLKEFSQGLLALVKSETNSNAPVFLEDDEVLDLSDGEYPSIYFIILTIFDRCCFQEVDVAIHTRSPLRVLS
jgi:hypothetical protein